MDSGLVAFAQAVIEQKPIKYFAGLLVLDLSGDPKEFHCTSPIQPSMLQQILWGNRLQKHVFSELLLAPLVNSLELSPTVVLVQQRDFLVARAKLPLPVVLVRRDDGSESLSRQEYISGKFSMGSDGADEFILECLVEHSEDLELARTLLRQFARACYPLEPFRRIEQALNLLKPKLEGKPTN